MSVSSYQSNTEYSYVLYMSGETCFMVPLSVAISGTSEVWLGLCCFVPILEAKMKDFHIVASEIKRKIVSHVYFFSDSLKHFS